MQKIYSKNNEGNLVIKIEHTKEEKKEIYQKQQEALNHILKETSKLMLSDDYKNRFIAERTQLVARARLLNDILLAYEDGILDDEPSYTITLLKKQLEIMVEYAEILNDRAKEENIELPDIYDLFKERID